MIIAARNEAKHLNELLKALQNQEHPNFEVILINDRSSEETNDILEQGKSETWLRILHIKTLPKGWTGKKYALKQGIASAKNEVLLFTDGDCLPKSSQWISLMTSGINKDKKIVLGYAGYKKDNSLLNQLIQFDTAFTALQYMGLAGHGLPYMAIGRNWAIWKESYPISQLEEMSGVIGGDDDLIAQSVCNSKNTIIQIKNDAQTTSKPKNQWDQFVHQKTRHLSVGIKYSSRIKTILSFFSLSYLVTWLLFGASLISGQWISALLIFGIRSLSFYIIFNRLGQKLDSKITQWALPLVELCYPFWYAFIGIRSLASKQIEWKAESNFLKKH